jgi:hypothetical protein
MRSVSSHGVANLTELELMPDTYVFRLTAELTQGVNGICATSDYGYVTLPRLVAVVPSVDLDALFVHFASGRKPQWSPEFLLPAM